MKHTLKAASDAGAIKITVYCISCVSSKDFYPNHALELWGTDATFPEIARRSRCKKCGRQASQAAPQWPPAHDKGGAPCLTPQGWENLYIDNPNRMGKRNPR